VDRRSQNFARMLAVVAEEKNEELVHLIFDHCLLAWRERGQEVDGIRMVRQATLTYLQAVAERAGELPIAASEPQVLFECRVVALDTARVKLLPVLEKTRRAISVETAP
ncbi:MAG: hypothetical protein IT423_24745, partial [Pirellulaceae bacterium]|nr:hypothetical protein [Pirellulaceae bacterium]